VFLLLFSTVGRYIAEEGEFVNDDWVGNVMGCSVADARKAAAQADTAAQMAMVFELNRPKQSGAQKPAGAERLLSKSQKKVGGGQMPDPLQIFQGLLDKFRGGLQQNKTKRDNAEG